MNASKIILISTLVVQQRLSVKQLKSIAENEHIPSFADSTTGCHQGLRFHPITNPRGAIHGGFSISIANYVSFC
jgi:hypothetical protein